MACGFSPRPLSGHIGAGLGAGALQRLRERALVHAQHNGADLVTTVTKQIDVPAERLDLVAHDGRQGLEHLVGGRFTEPGVEPAEVDDVQ